MTHFEELPFFSRGKKFFIVVQLFMRTSNPFKISKTTVYIWPFKTNDAKMKTFFFYESGHVSFFSVKKNVIA